MPINLFNNPLSSIKLGADNILKGYVGNSQIFPNDAEITAAQTEWDATSDEFKTKNERNNTKETTINVLPKKSFCELLSFLPSFLNENILLFLFALDLDIF